MAYKYSIQSVKEDSFKSVGIPEIMQWNFQEYSKYLGTKIPPILMS